VPTSFRVSPSRPCSRGSALVGRVVVATCGRSQAASPIATATACQSRPALVSSSSPSVQLSDPSPFVPLLQTSILRSSKDPSRLAHALQLYNSTRDPFLSRVFALIKKDALDRETRGGLVDDGKRMELWTDRAAGMDLAWLTFHDVEEKSKTVVERERRSKMEGLQ
jgi:hypothetical protein